MNTPKMAQTLIIYLMKIKMINNTKYLCNPLLFIVEQCQYTIGACLVYEMLLYSFSTIKVYKYRAILWERGILR